MEQGLIQTIVQAHLGRKAESITPIPTGKFNTSYFVDAASARYVLRIAPKPDAGFVFYERDMMRQEPGIHSLVRQHTEVPVARIVAYDDSHRHIERDYMLMERLPGMPLTEARGVDDAEVFRLVGAMLAEVHALTAERYGYLGEHEPMTPADTWQDAFRIMWGRMLDDIAETGHYTAKEADRLAALLDRHLALFDRQIPASLLHMDIWHQNVLVNGAGAVTGLIDWDRALWGDPEIEFAVLDYCGVSVPEFWRGYGQERDMSAEARTRQVFYLLYEMQKYIVIRHWRSRDPAAAAGCKARVMGVVRQCFGG